MKTLLLFIKMFYITTRNVKAVLECWNLLRSDLEKHLHIKPCCCFMKSV